MGLILNQHKLRAAAGSMHQFCQEVRDLFPGPADDSAIEAATYYVYLNMSRDVFGGRFTGRMGRMIRSKLKYATPPEIKQRVARINRRTEARDKALDKVNGPRNVEDRCRSHVTSVIKALLAEAGFHGDDPEVLRAAYTRFEDVVRDVKRHLTGIKDQNRFVINKSSRD
ncbi:MAG: hypothetical protein ACYS0D_11790 [Planctomycetota bacterium]|jgi:hypothetical protein